MTAPPSSSPTGARLWLAGARLRTLPAAVVPVAVGTAAATGNGETVSAWKAILALVVSLALQVATNYANDYSDGIRGTDDERRVGPLRLVGSGLASPRAVKRAALLSFAVAGVAGGILALTVGPELFVVGALSILAGWGYTGGPKPYGYLGLGEVFVFIFFGVVATVGSTYIQLERITALSLVASVGVGALATALLVVNNLRDRVGDEDAGKRTLAVRIGDSATRNFYAGLLGAAGLVTVAIAIMGRPGALLGAMALIFFALPPARAVVRDRAAGKALLPVLGQTGQAQLLYGIGVAVGLLVA